jgi:hypothetical protein
MYAAALPMREPARALLFWAPRVLTILFACFISLFAFDVFDGGLRLWMAVVAFLVHLIPTVVILLILSLAWRHEWVGALAYTSLGVWYLAMAWGHLHWSASASISGPLFLIGLMFFLNWLSRTRLHAEA